MATTVDVLQYVLGMDIKGLQAGAIQGDRIVSGMASSIKRTLMGLAGAFGVAFSLSAAIGELKSMISASMESERVYNRMRTAVELTGVSWNSVEGEIKDYAMELQKTTRFSDEQVIGVLQRITQLTGSLKKGYEGTRIALAMEAAGLMDAENAGRMLARAMEGQIGRLGMLVPLIGTHKKQIEEAASAEARWVLIKKDLITTFGESAGEIRTFEGLVVSLRNWIDELEEGFGAVIALQFASKVKEWRDAIIEFIESGNLEFWAKELGQAISGTIALIKDVTWLLQGLGILPEGIPKDIDGINKKLEETKGKLDEVKKKIESLGVSYEPGIETKRYIKELEDYIAMLEKAALRLETLGQMPGRRIELPEKPPPIDQEAVQKAYEGVAKQRMWLMDQMLKYDKISELEYKGMLERMLEDVRLTDEQKVNIRQRILETLFNMEKEAKDIQIQMDADANAIIAQGKEDMVQLVLDQMEVETERRKESLEASQEYLEQYRQRAIEIFSGVGDFFGNVFKNMFDNTKDWHAKMRSAFMALGNFIINLLAKWLASYITNCLVELGIFRATEKAKTAILAEELAKRAAMQAAYGVATGAFGIFGFLFGEGGFVGKMMQAGGFLRKFGIAEPGEYVIPAPAVASIGIPALEYMRRMGEIPSQPLVINMGGFSFSGMKKADAYFTKDVFRTAVVEAIKEARNNRDID